MKQINRIGHFKNLISFISKTYVNKKIIKKAVEIIVSTPKKSLRIVFIT